MRKGSAEMLERAISRRKFVAATAATAGVAAFTLGAECDPALIRRLQQTRTAAPPHHSTWVWQFGTDGDPSRIAAALSPHGLGVIVKTHDGVEWMNKYDGSPHAVNGPAQVANLARYFEDRRVLFHAWCVVKGMDPVREAAMAAEVLDAGARSVVLDLEGSSGFWAGSTDDARRFGDELRRLTPFGRVDISIDPRPWRINLAPMPEFVAATDAIWPQLYWDTFNTPSNIEGYRASGYPVGSDGMTPEFLLDVTSEVLEGYGREVIPVGQGAAADPDTWPRFASRAWELGMGSVSVWRHGVARAETIEYLGDNPAGLAPKPPPRRTPTRTASPTKTVKPTRTASPTRTRTSTPSRTATPSKTPTPSRTPTVAPAATDTPVPVVTP